MQHSIKHKLFSFTIPLVMFALVLVGMFGGGIKVHAASDNPSLCFLQLTGTLYRCRDVSPGDSAVQASGTCWTSDSTVVKNELVWVTADCSGSSFQAAPAAECSGNSPSTSDCCQVIGNSNSCALPVRGSGSNNLTICSGNASCTSVVNNYLNPVIDFLAAGVGIIVTSMIVIAGIQYITSQDNPQAVSAARNRIFNAVIALVIFGLMYALLQWLVPGGIFHG